MWWSWRLIFHQRSSSPAMDLPQRKQEAISVNLSLTKQKNCWIQASSDRNHQKYQPIFIYKVDGDGWYVNNSLGKKKEGWLARTNTLPLAGWKVFGIEEDPTLSITIGAMEPNCDNVTITLSGKPAEKVPEVQGRYKKQNMIWQGHHVYKSNPMDFICTLIGLLVITGLLVQSWEALGN